MPGNGIRELCGSVAGYNKHLRHGEPTCRPCKDANNEKSRDYYRQTHPGPPNRRWAGWVRDAALDYVETHGPIRTTPLFELMRKRYPHLRFDSLNRALHRLKNRGELATRPVVDVWGMDTRRNEWMLP